jgi:hypothetical protein
LYKCIVFILLWHHAKKYSRFQKAAVFFIDHSK